VVVRVALAALRDVNSITEATEVAVAGRAPELRRVFVGFRR
jgi:hypothetical protein